MGITNWLHATAVFIPVKELSVKHWIWNLVSTSPVCKVLQNITRQKMNCTYKRNLETRYYNHWCNGKAVLHIVSALVCVCSLSYPACNAHAPYCHLWPAPLYSTFPHYLIKGTIFEKNVTEHKGWVLISSTFVWNISHSKKKWTRYDQKCTLVFM